MPVLLLECDSWRKTGKFFYLHCLRCTRFIRNKDLVLVALEKVAQEPNILLPLRSLIGWAAAFTFFLKSHSHGEDNI